MLYIVRPGSIFSDITLASIPTVSDASSEKLNVNAEALYAKDLLNQCRIQCFGTVARYVSNVHLLDVPAEGSALNPWMLWSPRPRKYNATS